MTQIPSDDILESFWKVRIRESETQDGIRIVQFGDSEGQNSVNKEVLEIVGNGKPTDSVRKERIAVSDTIRMSVQNRHSRILLQDLLRGRMGKMHQPEVLETEIQVGEWLDCRARITSKELAPIHFVTNGILQHAGSTSPRMDADLGKSALMRIVRFMNRLAKGLQRMVTKVQWLCWKGMSSIKEQGDLFWTLTHQVHDNWVAYFRIWSGRSLYRFCWRAQAYGNQSDV